MMPNWDEDERGLVIFKPVVGWETALLAQIGCSVRVRFVHRPEDIGKQPEAIQLAMMPMQARQLARDLIDMAEKAESVPPGTVPS
jgi:hypothetical protein